jgi:hypothetical protein
MEEKIGHSQKRQMMMREKFWGESFKPVLNSGIWRIGCNVIFVIWRCSPFQKVVKFQQTQLYLDPYEYVHINTFKYYVSGTDGKILVTIIYFYYLFFHHRPTHKLCFISCKPFVVNATFSTVLAYRKENTTCEWNNSGKIGNKDE